VSVSDDEQWKVGELARATGLTVRALHHYDELGLLVPSERTSAGYRLYGQRDVRRLYRIVALRCLGLRLDEISAVIDGHGLGLGETVARQTEAVDRQLEDLRRVRDRLVAISDVLDRQEKPSIDQLTRTMEAMGVHEKYYTSEQLEQLRQRGDELGHEAIEAPQREWGEIFAALRVEMEAGTDPGDPQLASYRDRSQRLLSAFTGGDAAMTDSMRRMWDNEDPENVQPGHRRPKAVRLRQASVPRLNRTGGGRARRDSGDCQRMAAPSLG